MMSTLRRLKTAIPMGIALKQRPVPSLWQTLICLCLSVVLWGGVAAGQDLSDAPIPVSMPKELPMESQLYDAEQMAARIPMPELREELARRGVPLRADGMVYVDIAGPRGADPLPASAIVPLGAEFDKYWRGRTVAWVPVGQLSNIARALPPGYFMEMVPRPSLDEPVEGEGPEAIGSDHYRDAGANGSGVTIAVIDIGFANLSNARDHGDAPALTQTDMINYTPSGFEDGDNKHGTGCVEAAYDHCPGANWRLYKIDDLTDLDDAVNDAINHGVDVITHSLSWYNRGWEDDTGEACAAATTAANNGIVFFTSAGNRAKSHYQGMFNDSDSDSWHNFSATDETIDISISEGKKANFKLSWDTSGGIYDLDLYLYNPAIDSVLASSTNSGNNYEKFSWTNDLGSTQTVHLAVIRVSGGITEFEIFMSGSGTWQEHTVALGSTTSPSNTTHPLLISVGAVRHEDFDSSPGATGILKDYSSRGPSNSGMTLPDLCGPTDTKGYTYSQFTGTSCATPNVAGAATTFWSCEPQMSGENVQELFLEMAGLFRDWGTTGADNLYGEGGATAPKNHSTIVLLNRGLGNTQASVDLPYYNVSDAQSYASNGARMLFLDGSYPDTITLYKPLFIDNYGSPAVVGAQQASDGAGVTLDHQVRDVLVQERERQAADYLGRDIEATTSSRTSPSNTMHRLR